MNAQTSSSAIQLYGAVLSGHTHRVQLFLNLLGLPYEFVNVNLAGGENHRAEFLALSPFGEVPVLRDGDVVLTDSTAILVYLASRHDSGGHWLPREPVAAATVQRWLSNASGKIAFGPCAVRLVKLFGKALDYDTAAAISQRVLAVMELELSGKKFALGDQVSIADVAAFSYIEHAPEGGISLAPYPHIRAWLDRVRALPGFVAMPASAHPGE